MDPEHYFNSIKVMLDPPPHYVECGLFWLRFSRYFSLQESCQVPI